MTRVLSLSLSAELAAGTEPAQLAEHISPGFSSGQGQRVCPAHLTRILRLQQGTEYALHRSSCFDVM